MADCKSDDDAFVLASAEADPMNVVAVIQHTAGEYLGLIEDHLEGSHTGAGGTINTYVKLEGPIHAILQRVLITGDFFVTPPRVIFDLEAALAGTRLNEVEATIRSFFETTDIDMLSVSADDFIASINDSLAKRVGA